MKVQDVLLKAMAKKISWVAAAEIIGVTPRTMRRWRERLEEHGYSGLADRRKGKVSFRRIPLKRVEEVLALYQERIRERLKDVSHYEQVQRFALLPRGFTIEEGELTAKLSLRRKVIEQHFAADIESLYRRG